MSLDTVGGDNILRNFGKISESPSPYNIVINWEDPPERMIVLNFDEPPLCDIVIIRADPPENAYLRNCVTRAPLLYFMRS